MVGYLGNRPRGMTNERCQLIHVIPHVPLPLHATAWLGALGNAGRAQAFGIRPLLVGHFGAAVVHALASLPWVVLIVGVGLCAVEPELEESALLDYGPGRVLLHVTLRRALGAIADRHRLEQVAPSRGQCAGSSDRRS